MGRKAENHRFSILKLSSLQHLDPQVIFWVLTLRRHDCSNHAQCCPYYGGVGPHKPYYGDIILPHRALGMFAPLEIYCPTFPLFFSPTFSSDGSENMDQGESRHHLAVLNDLLELVQHTGVDKTLLPYHAVVLVLAVVGISHLQAPQA